MLINGKEVAYNYKQTESIQKDINKISQLPDELRQGITEKNIKDLNLVNADDMPSLQTSNFDFFGDSETEVTRSRKENYDTFKEMDKMEFIHRALETIADDAAQKNDDGNVIKIYSNDEEKKNKLEDLFYNRLNINKELWNIVFETCKMGDAPYEIIPDSYDNPKKIARIRYLEPSKFERVEINDKLAFFNYKEKIVDSRTKVKTGEKIYRLEPWQIVHFKIDNKEFNPYGGSLLVPGMSTFKRLSLLEDVILVYRISRSPERRVFYVDVGQLSPVEAKRFLQKFRDNYRTQQFIGDDGTINRKANVLSITSDIFIPVREGSGSTRIDTLQSGQALSTIDDLKYFKEKILMTMNVPLEYLEPSAGAAVGRGSLSMIDQKFARYVERIQGHIEDGLNKLAALELFFSGYKKEDLQDFRIEFTPPSNVKEITDMEFVNQRMTLIGTIVNLNLFPTKWILKNIMKMSDKEINDVMLYKRLEDQNKNQAVPNMGMGGLGGGEMMPEVPMAASPEQAPELASANTEQPSEENAAMPVPEVAPEENTTAQQEQLIIDLLGKDFILENQKDFFKIVKALDEKKEVIKEEEKQEEADLLIEAIQSVLYGDGNLIQQKVEAKKTNKTKKLSSMFIQNEFGGLEFNEDRSISVFKEEKDDYKQIKKKLK